MANFSFETDVISLPKGAISRTHRRSLRWRGKVVLAFTRGQFRAYLYPVYTPSGYAVTTESPADHPHHNSVWIAADHLHCRMPLAGGRYEEATYNFYVNETFQGRAPGRILEVSIESAELSERHFRVIQQLEWRGPVEWGAEQGRVVAQETRTTDIRVGDVAHLIDIRSRLTPTDWDFTIGPTRHAYFGVRVAESMRVIKGGVLIDADGRRGGEEVTGVVSAWIDYSGPVAEKRKAGIGVFPNPATSWSPWFATDWGTIAVNSFGSTGRFIPRGDALELAMRLVAHDGDATTMDLPGLYAAYLQEVER